MPQLATLYGPNGQAQVVTVGSTQASQLQSQGWGLTAGSYQNPNAPPSGAVPINGAQYNTTALQQANFSNIYQQGNTLYGVPIVPSSMTSGQINNTSNINTTPPPSQTNPQSYAAAQNSYFQELMAQYTQQQAQQQQFVNQQNEHRNSLTELMKTLGNKGNDYRAELEKYNVTGNTNQLMDIMKQIAGANAGFEKMKVDNQGRAVMTSMIGGQESLIRRQQAAEIGAMTSVAQALQGNIALAYDTAEKAINIKYEPIENQIKMEMQQLEFISQDLDRADRQASESRQQVLQQQLQRLEDLKQEETQKQNIALELAQSGASQNTIDGILKAKTLNEAIAISGPSYLDAAMMKEGYEYVNTPAKRDQLKKQGYEIIQRGGRTYAMSPTLMGQRKGSGGGGGSGGFTPQEKRRLEQKGLINAPYQKQLDFLYGEGTGENVEFYVQQYLEGNESITNPDGSVNFSAIPADLRNEFFARLEQELAAQQSDYDPNDINFGQFAREIPGAAKKVYGMGKNIFQRFLNLF